MLYLPPSIHPDNNNGYTLVNGINSIALTREQINKFIDAFIKNSNKNYTSTLFQNKSQNNEKVEELKEINEETVYEVVSKVQSYYYEGIRNDFVLYFSGWLRKLGLSYNNAEKIINELAIDDEERKSRIKTLKETYQEQDLDQVAGYSGLLELLSNEFSSNSSRNDAIEKLKENNMLELLSQEMDLAQRRR